jgi:hypothetical protein
MYVQDGNLVESGDKARNIPSEHIDALGLSGGMHTDKRDRIPFETYKGGHIHHSDDTF